ncbi:MAG: S9 family peptidase, partial [Candidatus Dormibacteria bacterium]
RIDDQRSGHGAPQPWFSSSGEEVVFTASSHGSTRLWTIPLSGGQPRAFGPDQCRLYGATADASRRRVAAALSTDAIPGDLYLLEGGVEAATPPRRLTCLNQDLFDEVRLAGMEEVTAHSSDGTPIQAWVMRPPGSKPSTTTPGILQVHGGPAAMYGHSFFSEFQVLAAQGYAIIFCNPRGSTGYGRAFSSAVNGDWGGKDWADISAALDAALAVGGIDPERLGVAGGSYGGYMTLWAIGHTQRFKAAVAMRSVANLVSFFGNSDIGWWMVDEMGGLPWEGMEILEERSPSTYLTEMRTPLLLLHSESDLRCPIEQSEEIFTALKYMGREVRLVRFDEQSHDLSRSGHPRSRLVRLRLIRDWFTQHIAV